MYTTQTSSCGNYSQPGITPWSSCAMCGRARAFQQRLALDTLGAAGISHCSCIRYLQQLKLDVKNVCMRWTSICQLYLCTRTRHLCLLWPDFSNYSSELPVNLWTGKKWLIDWQVWRPTMQNVWQAIISSLLKGCHKRIYTQEMLTIDLFVFGCTCL